MKSSHSLFGSAPYECTYPRILVPAAAYPRRGEAKSLTFRPAEVMPPPIFSSCRYRTRRGIAHAWPREALIGVWLGCFLIDFLTPFRLNAGSSYPILAPLIFSPSLGLGAACQALVECDLDPTISANSPMPLTRSSEILKFLILGGPIAALMNSTWGTSALYLAHIITKEVVAFTWLNWWIGDTIGVMVVTPIILSLFGKPGTLWSKRRWAIAIPLAIAMALNVTFFFNAEGREARTTKLEFERTANRIANQVRKNFEGYLDSLYGIETVLKTHDIVTRQIFHDAATRWLERYSGIYDLAWIPRVPDPLRRAHERKMRRDGFLGMARILAPEKDGILARAPRRAEYLPGDFVEPFRESESVIGFDMSGSDERLRAIYQTRDTGKPAATSPLQLVQAVSDRHAVLVFQAVYKGDESSVEARRRNWIGVVSAVIRMRDVIETSFRGQSDDQLKLALFDDTPSKGKPIYLQDFESTSPALPFPLTVFETPLTLADRQFWLKITPTDAYVRQVWDHGPWLVLVSGMFLSGLLAAFLLAITGHSYAIEQELLERMRISDQLKRNSEELSRSNADLEHFAYASSHDMQEPLRMISTYLQLIQRRSANSFDDESRQYFSFVLEGASRMRALIIDLLEYSRVGRTGAKREETNVRALIEVAIQNLQVSIKESRTEIEVGRMPTLSIVPMEGIQLFQNLIGNAIKYRDKQRPPKIEVEARKDVGELAIFRNR